MSGYIHSAEDTSNADEPSEAKQSVEEDERHFGPDIEADDNGQRNLKKYTKAELEAMLVKFTEEHGRPPTRKEFPATVVAQVKREWGKWIYALEQTGVIPVSEERLENRRLRRESLVEKRAERRKRRKH